MEMNKIKYYGKVQSTRQQYSLLTGRGDGDSLDFKDPRIGWTKSSHDYSGIWSDDGPMEAGDLPFLLVHFGLSEVEDTRLSDLETVRYMSPATLIGIRRTYEAMTGAPRHEAISQRMGGHIPAELVKCTRRRLALADA